MENKIMYDQWIDQMEEEIKDGYRCGKCGKVILMEENSHEEYANDEICNC